MGIKEWFDESGSEWMSGYWVYRWVSVRGVVDSERLCQGVNR